MQVDEYKQLKESLNRAPNQRQHEPNTQHLPDAAIPPESYNHEAQETTVLKLPHEEEPAQEGGHHDHQDTQSRVKWGSSSY